MTTVFGWWDWDAEGPGLVNRVTGERVVFRGKAQEANLLPETETWLRFDYQHPELALPVFARERMEAWQARGKPDHLVSWTVDYHLSAKLWQRQARTASIQPSYGVWRRVDDCLTDALSCWPAIPQVGHRLTDHVYFSGGWHNGAWSSDLQRTYRRINEKDHTRASSPVSDAWVIPLDTPTPSPWVFHPFPPESDLRENPEIEAEVLLDGLSIGLHDRKLHFDLPAGIPLGGLEGRTAYLRTEDGKRVLYPKSGDTRRGGHSRESFRLIYADDEIVCGLSAYPWKEMNEAAEWSAYVSWHGGGWRARPGEVITDPPTREQWLCLKWAFFDGWLNWDGTTARCPEWWPELRLARAYAVNLGQACCGGMSAAHFGARVMGEKPVVTASDAEIVALARRLWNSPDLKAAFQRAGRHGDLTKAEQAIMSAEIKSYRSGDLWNRNQNDLALAAFLLRQLGDGSLHNLDSKEANALLAERKMPVPGKPLMTLLRQEVIDFAELLRQTPEAWAVIKQLGKGPFPAIWEVDKARVLDKLEADFRAKYGLYNRAGFALTEDLWRAAAQGDVRGFDSPKALAMIKSNRFVRADDEAPEPVSESLPWLAD